MPKVIGNGRSTRKDARRAAEEATREALKRLGTAKVAFGFVFASPTHDLGVVMAEVQRASGCFEILGSSTAGELTEQGKLEGVVVMLVASSDTQQRLGFGRGLKANHKKLATEFAQIASAMKPSARAAGLRHLTTVLLTDGLAGTGEDLVNAMFQQSTSISQIIGGAAGDGGRFKETVVGAARDSASDAAAVLQIFDANPWGIGVEHGLRPTTKPARVTASSRNVIYAIDGRPAFDVYRRHAQERGISLNHANAGAYMIANELGVHFFSSLSRARAALSVGADGSLTCAAPVPEGSFVSILDGDPTSMVSAAKTAAHEARDNLGTCEPAGVLVFDCVCRGMILKENFGDEIAAVRSVFGNVPVTGFLTYGEIALCAGRLEGWHNATVVVVAIPQ
jgi:methyl-accepting chemotaxis protein